MPLFTAILKRNAGYWLALCLENGIVGQGETPDGAIEKLKEAMGSFQAVYQSESNIYCAPISIAELHEFLMIGSMEPSSETYELRAVYA